MLRDHVTVLYSNGNSATINVHYPWKPLSCTKCLIFGHSDFQCKNGVAHAACPDAMHVPGYSDVPAAGGPLGISGANPSSLGESSGGAQDVASLTCVTPKSSSGKVPPISAMTACSLVDKVSTNPTRQSPPTTRQSGGKQGSGKAVVDKSSSDKSRNVNTFAVLDSAVIPMDDSQNAVVKEGSLSSSFGDLMDNSFNDDVCPAKDQPKGRGRTRAKGGGARK